MNIDESAEFNLIYEKWIIVKTLDGLHEEVSLLDIFRNAQDYLTLENEIKPLNIAILRLLLAILHCALGGKDIEGNPFPDDEEDQIDGALELWNELKERKCFPYERIESYLKEHEDRFWLFHPETPFYQIACINNGTEYSAAKLNGEVLESSNKPRLFPQRAGKKKHGLSFSEAARWILYVIGFDDTSAKPSKRGQKMPSPGAGWLGQLGLITAEGKNLFETLMLNLVLLPETGLWGDDKAIWEIAPRTKERVQINIPNSQAALLTLQSRRLKLIRDGDAVTGYLLLGGDFFTKENSLVEQMTVWRNSKKESAPPEYVPRRHNPSVQMWRDFAPLVGQGIGAHCPGVVHWLKKFELEDPVIRFQICGVKYGDKDFFVEDVFFDSLSFNVDLLYELDWIPRIIDELGVTEKLVREVGILAQNIAKAVGNENGYAARDEAKEQAYFRLDRPFRKWLEGLDPSGDKMEEECEKWFTEAKIIIHALGNEIANDCSPQALTGRNGISTPKALNWFFFNTKNRNTLNIAEINRKKGGAKSEN